MVRTNKGFTLVELLAVVVILGILMGVGIPAVSKHLQKSREESYDVMINSIHDGAMSYMMDKNVYPTGTSEDQDVDIAINDLEEAGYVESLSDPGSSGKCSGTVEVVLEDSGDANKLSEYKYTINLNCPSKTINETITS